MRNCKLYFYVSALYGKTKNLKYMMLRLHQNECLVVEVFLVIDKQMENFIKKLSEQLSPMLKG
jgi:hypothetical protein